MKKNIVSKIYLNKFKYGIEFLLSMLLLISFIIVVYIGNKNGLEINSNINNVVEIAFGNEIGLVSIWISGYFILIQLYKNTYPMKIIERSFLKKVKIILLFSFITILIGILILTNWNNILTEIYFLVLFLINISMIFYNTYMINRDFKLNTYVDRFLKKISKKIINSNIEKFDVNRCFYELVHFSEECSVKEDYYICSIIERKISFLFKELIKNCNKLVLEGKKEIAEYIFDEIINFESSQIYISRNSKSDLYIYNLFNCQQNNVIFCYEINNMDWFKKYIIKINSSVINICINDEKEKSSVLIDSLYHLNEDIGLSLLSKEDKDNKWLHLFLEELYNINIAFKFEYRNISISNFGRLLIELIRNENIDKKKYELCKGFLTDYTKNIIIFNDNIQEIVLYYSLYADKLIDDNNIDKIKDFIEILTNEKVKIILDEKWNDFIFWFLNTIMNKWDDELGSIIRKKIIDRIIVLSYKKDSNNYFSSIPKYDVLIFKNRYDSNTINTMCEELEELLTRLIYNENGQMFYMVLDLIKDCFTRLENKDKNIQIKLFDLIIKAMKICLNKNEERYFYTVINIIEDLVKDLNKEKKISKDFGKYIIDKLGECAEYSNINEEYAIMIIELLFSFINENEKYYFLDKEHEKYLYRKVYNIGIDCIENNQERSLRHVSNTLGWFTVWSIDNNPQFMTQYLLQITMDLFRISKNMYISQKTQIFILTLFTTVGTYCCKDNKNIKLLESIIDFLNKEDKYRINTAIDLRTKENDMWDKLFEGNTQELTRKFLKKFNEKK